MLVLRNIPSLPSYNQILDIYKLAYHLRQGIKDEVPLSQAWSVALRTLLDVWLSGAPVAGQRIRKPFRTNSWYGT
jgi:hypothetical protein